MVDLPSRLLHSPKVGLGVATAALVALSTGGTMLLVSHGNHQLQPIAPVVAAPQAPLMPRAPVVVDRAPGTVAAPPTRAVVLRPAVVRPQPPAPAEVSPREPAPPVLQPPVVQPPVLNPPVVEPPVLEPPVVDPPVLGPPVVEPPVLDPALAPAHRGPTHPEHPDDPGKHLGQLKH